MPEHPRSEDLDTAPLDADPGDLAAQSTSVEYDEETDEGLDDDVPLEANAADVAEQRRVAPPETDDRG